MWKFLFKAAMSYIDPDQRGYGEIFTFFDEYVDFEELIFASDAFYRGHTLHCIWFYFLGEYIYHQKEFAVICSNIKAYGSAWRNFLSIIKKVDDSNSFTDVIKAMEEYKRIFDLQDSIRCVAALTHDLGYPLTKITKINKSIKKILPFFAIQNFGEFNFSYREIQLNFINNFLNFLSDDIIIRLHDNDQENVKILSKFFIIDKVTNSITGFRTDRLSTLTVHEKTILQKLLLPKYSIRKNITKRLRFTNDFEKFEHGIMSAFLLFKTPSAFRNMKYAYVDDQNLDLSWFDFSDVESKRWILNAMANHTSSGYKILGIYTESDLLAIIDESEEFSRISRASQSRQFINEFCKTKLYMSDGILKVDFIFDNDFESINPERAFKGRCKRLLTLFDIGRLDPSLKIELRCIGKLPKDNNTYALNIGRKHAKILINRKECDISDYLNSHDFPNQFDR